MTTSTDISVIAGDAGERLDIFGGPMIVKADGSDLPMFVAENPIPPGYMVPPHVHEHDDEVIQVLEGDLTLMGAEGESIAPAGSTVRLPRGSVHGFRNDTDGIVRLMVIAQPGLQSAEMFRHFDRAGKATPGGLTPPEIVAICAQYGVRMG